MNRKVAIIVALQAFLIIMMFWVIVFYGKDEYEAYTREQEEEIDTPNRVSTELGATVVTLSEQGQAQSDIQTTALRGSSQQQSLDALGSVVSIDPLLELRTRYLTAIADANIAQASLTSSQQEYQRLQQLNQDNRNISDRVAMAAQAQFRTDQAKLQAAQIQAGNVRDNMRQLWGDTLAAQATQQPASTALQQLLQYREVLLQLTLPFDTAAPRANAIAWVTPAGSQGKPVKAVLVSASPQTDNTLQGKTYFYRAPADNLRAGMRVRVRVDGEQAASQTGVEVPSSAVVWYGGKAWVYRKQGEEKFTRLPISTEHEAGDGWFTGGLLKAGDQVVTNGAQLLLSEEFKYQIKNENED